MASLWGTDNFITGLSGGWGNGCPKKRSSPVNDDCYNQNSPCKRFASEELVTAHLRDLDLSSTPSPHTPHSITPSHPLLVTGLTQCPGYGLGSHTPSHISHSHASQPNTAWSTMEVDKDTLIRGASPLRLIDDTSCSSSWDRGEEAGPPVYPVRASPNSQWQWNTSYDPLHTLHSEGPTASSKFVNELPPGENSSMQFPLSVSSPSQSTSSWDHVTMEDYSSEGSDGDSESSGPERPISLWLSPELLDCANKIATPLPQTLVDKYKKPAGMELMLWVDPSTRLKSIQNSNEVEMVDSAEMIASSDDMDS